MHQFNYLDVLRNIYNLFSKKFGRMGTKSLHGCQSKIFDNESGAVWLQNLGQENLMNGDEITVGNHCGGSMETHLM